MTPWLAIVLLVVLFAGGLFGYDQGVISGALHGIKETFSLSVLMIQVVTSWVTLGALMGSLAGGELGDRIGRKRTMLIAGALFTLGAVVQWLAPDVVVLVAGRLMVGVGVGVAAVAGPVICRRAGARRPARPLCLRLPACDHHRHLPGLPGRRMAVRERVMARDAGCGSDSGCCAVHHGARGTGVATLVDDEAPARRCRGGVAESPAGD